MKRSLLCFLSIYAVLVAGCESNTDSDHTTIPDDVILPLAVNNEWVYSETFYDTNGVISRQNSYSYAIVKDSMRLGEKIYIDENGYQYANRTDGLWYLTDGLFYNEQRLAFKYPCKLGDTFPAPSFNYSGSDGDVVTMTVATVNANVTVPAGTYTCIKYVGEGYMPATDQKTDRRIYYIAPKVGIVLIEDYDYIPNQTDPPLAFRTELTRVTLK
jgi:hypothetical protein